jgi:histidine triad (HIT) family protein
VKDCVFCQIIRGEKPAEIVYQGESVIAFKDIKPHAPVHILLVPKNHIRSINDLADEDRPVSSELVLRARQIAEELGIRRSGYKLVFNVERGGGQYVFHLHLHLIGGWETTSVFV